MEWVVVLMLELEIHIEVVSIYGYLPCVDTRLEGNVVRGYKKVG